MGRVEIAGYFALGLLLQCHGHGQRAVVSTTLTNSTGASTCSPLLTGPDVFERAQVEGTFVVRDEETGCSRSTHPALADTPFRPQSTFKIPNALVGLETGVIEGEHHLWRWDGTPRPLKDWEQDLDLGGALRVSCVPCFQEVARRVGRERMAHYLHAFQYGNEAMGDSVDAFWLGEGPLRITPRGQTEFLHRLVSGELPVQSSHRDLVRRLLEVERGAHHRYWGKTGLGTMDGRAIGWWVGGTEVAGHRYVFALFLRGGTQGKAEEERIQPLRKELARELLVRAGALPR